MKKIILIAFFSCLYSFSSGQLIIGDSTPVRLSYLRGDRTITSNQLNWAVSCFLDYANFEIQRSANGLNYYTIHTFQADEIRCRQPFNYSDPQPSGKFYYRIRVGDLNGKFYSSKIVTLYGETEGFDITAITPTIITDNGVLNLSSSASGRGEIIITPITGIVAKKITFNIQKGSNTIPLQLSSFTKGIYFISVTNSAGEKRVSRFIKN